MSPLFSIIIPVYNSERCLIECVQSVLKQDFKAWEIILVDDCSTDKSNQICLSLGKENEALKVIRHKENSGVSASRNTGIDAACGEYIIFLDSDDCLFNGCLNGIAKLIGEKTDLDVIIAGYIRDYENPFYQKSISDNTVINNRTPDEVIAYINSLDDFLCTCWRFIIKRIFIIKNDLYFSKAKIYEDQYYVARLLCLGRKFAFYPEHFYYNRASVASLSLSIDYNSTASCLEVANDLGKFAKNNNLSDSRKEFLHARMKYVLKVFQAYLSTHDAKEIYELSKIIEQNIDNFKILKRSLLKRDICFSNKTGAVYKSLLLYKTFVIKETVALIKNKKCQELYIFCAGVFGRITLRILRNEGYRVKGFLDNNKEWQGGSVLGLKVSSPAILSGKSKEELSNIFVIVCNQERSAFREIVSQLERMGLHKGQIAHKIFEG
jgi:glycosyltransferase involved in cell wall biosynthesis